MKRILIYIFILSIAAQIYAVPPRDVYPPSDIKRHRDRDLTDLILPQGAGQGQMLYWDTTIPSWMATATPPAADRMAFWDNSETSIDWLAAGTGLAITATTMNIVEGEIDHGGLAGLGDAADHVWAVDVNGTRDLTGDWVISTNSVTLTAGTLSAANVAVGVGITPALGRFAIGSADNTDQIEIFHDNTDAFIKWTDGSLIVQADESNTDGVLSILGNGTGLGKIALNSATPNIVLDGAVHSVRIGDNTSGSGSFSTKVGKYAGENNSASGLTCMGYDSGGSSAGNNSTTIGRQSGTTATGTALTAVGYLSAFGNSGANVTAVGQQAGRNNLSVNLAAFGSFAAFHNTGGGVTAFGTLAAEHNGGSSVIALGNNSLAENAGSLNTAVGGQSFNTWTDGITRDFTPGDTNPSLNRVTIIGHGYTAYNSTGGYLSLKLSTTGTLPAGLGAGSEIWQVIDSDTLECHSDTFSDGGSGTHTFTPKVRYINSTALGYNAEPDASNQVMLGDTNVTEVKTSGSITSLGAGDNTFAGNIGIKTTTPRRTVDILDTTNPQLRLTQADNTVYSEFKTDSLGILNITTTGLATTLLNGQELRFSDTGDSNYVGFKAPALTANQIWTLPIADGDPGAVLTTDGSGVTSWTDNASEKTWAFMSRDASSGTNYIGGFYKFGTTDNDFNPSITFGTVNVSYAAHFFLVQAAGASGGVDTVIRVTGTTIDDNGNRTTGVNVDITVDDAGAAGTYYETTEKWLGQVTVAKQSGPDLLCNYGYAKYWDNNNTDFKVVGVEATWLGAKNDANPDIHLHHHKSTGWTYNAGSAPTSPTEIATMNGDHVTEIQIAVDQEGAWKRTNLSTDIMGSNGEGTIIELTTTTNRTYAIGNFLVRITPQ